MKTHPRLQGVAALLVLLIPRFVPALDLGEVVKGLQVVSVDGRPVSLTPGPGTHATAVVFLSTTCPYANFYSDHLRDLDQKLGPKGLLLVVVNSNRNETVEEVILQARHHRFAFPVIKDDEDRIADALGARVTPEAFLLDQEGRLRYRGRIRSKQGGTELEDAILDLLAHRPVKTPFAKAFGCAIARVTPSPG